MGLRLGSRALLRDHLTPRGPQARPRLERSRAPSPRRGSGQHARLAELAFGPGKTATTAAPGESGVPRCGDLACSSAYGDCNAVANLQEPRSRCLPSTRLPHPAETSPTHTGLATRAGSRRGSIARVSMSWRPQPSCAAIDDVPIVLNKVTSTPDAVDARLDAGSAPAGKVERALLRRLRVVAGFPGFSPRQATPRAC